GERGPAGHLRLHELVEDAGRIEAALDLGVGEERLDLRAEDDPVRGPRPEQRLDPEAIADEDEAIAGAVVEGERELAAQAGERAVEALARVEVEEELGVALGPEARAAGDEVGAEAGVAVELAVVGDEDLAVRRRVTLPRPRLGVVVDRLAGVGAATAT